MGKLSYKRFNPNFHHLKASLIDDDIRFVFLYGGSSSSKSYSISQAVLLECLKGYNTMVFRKTGATISDSIYKTFREAVKSLNIESFFTFQENLIKCVNGFYITFKGLDDPEKIKGLESYQYVFCEEISEFDESDFKQIRKRLRGRKGQKIIAAFNPISEDHWIKRNVFDKEILIEVSNNLYGRLKDISTGDVLPEEYSTVSKKWTNSSKTIFNPRSKEYEEHGPDMVIIRSTYLDNFWVVGSPDGLYGYYDSQVIADFEKDKENDYPYYQVYALGEWGTIKTGGEFFRDFEAGKHIGDCFFDISLPVHITIDNNVLPYISIAIWQIHPGDVNEVYQIHEIAAVEPFNTATKASALVVKYLEEIGYEDKVYLYGDVSTKAGNTIDDNKLSFFDKFKEVIESSYVVEERMPKSNPSVPLSGEFINSIYSGVISNIRISIDRKCSISINDYVRVKKDVNGAILKQRIKNKETGQTYEQYGHFSDTKRYFIVEAFKDDYVRFSLKRNRNKITSSIMKYYDKSKIDLSKGAGIVEICPEINGKYVFVRAVLYGGKCYIQNAMLSEDIIDVDDIFKFVEPDDRVQIECDSSFSNYVHGFRMRMDVFGRKIIPNANKRITAQLDYIRENMYFPNDYDNDSLFCAFMENVLDYDDKNNIEGVNSLAAIADRILRS